MPFVICCAQLLGAARWRRRGVNMDLWGCPGRWTEPRQLVGSRRCPERSSSLVASVLLDASALFGAMARCHLLGPTCVCVRLAARFDDSVLPLAFLSAKTRPETAKYAPRAAAAEPALASDPFPQSQQACDRCSSVAPPRASRPRCSLHSSRRYNKNQRSRYRRRR